MLYASGEVLKIDNQEDNSKKRWTSIIKRFLQKHKFITTVIAIFGVCSIMNFVLIYNFIEILRQLKN